MESTLNRSDDVDVKRVRRQVRKKVVHGTVTADDWRELARADPGIARRELERYLRAYEPATPTNPFRSSGRSIGLLIGFALGVAAMVSVWIVMPGLHERWDTNDSPLAGLATVAMLGASLLPLLVAFLGWRYDRARAQAPGQQPCATTFDELLARFERLQRDLHRT